jgi:hypothetical protein
VNITRDCTIPGAFPNVHVKKDTTGVSLESMEKVKSTIRQLARDWSEEVHGQFLPIISLSYALMLTG